MSHDSLLMFLLMEAVASSDFFVAKFCKILTTKIQKGLYSVSNPLCFKKKKIHQNFEKNVFYWESLATFPHSFNCQGSFFSTSFLQTCQLMLFPSVRMITREGGLSGDSCNRLDSWAPLFVPAAPQEREEKKKKTKKTCSKQSSIDWLIYALHFSP
jgi:hypothetical protein